MKQSFRLQRHRCAVKVFISSCDWILMNASIVAWFLSFHYYKHKRGNNECLYDNKKNLHNNKSFQLMSTRKKTHSTRERGKQKETFVTAIFLFNFVKHISIPSLPLALSLSVKIVDPLKIPRAAKHSYLNGMP